MSESRAYLLCRFAENSGLYSGWMNQAPVPTTVVDEFLPDWQIPEDAGILITHMHYRWEELSTLRAIHQQARIPILIISDGILEYRNTWEHPDLVEGSMFQPLFGHKLACIGRGQARVVESWGNLGSCEVVGIPRLDEFDRSKVKRTQRSGPFRVMVATANTPAFNDRQRTTVVESLKQIKNWIESNGDVRQRPLEVTWRLSDGLAADIGLPKEVDGTNRPPLGEAIESVDAVITTPSTLYLESVLRTRPTALLDFHGTPQYVTPAWTIRGPRDLASVMFELESPPPPKMMFQNQILNDQLECQTPATPRLCELMKRMIDAGIEARRSGRPLELPARMLTEPRHGFAEVPVGFDLANLYPDNSVFQNRDVQRLQIELAAAIKRLDQLPMELAEKNKHIAKLTRALDHSRDRVEEMHNRVVAIRRRFGVEPAKPKVEGRDIVDEP